MTEKSKIDENIEVLKEKVALNTEYIEALVNEAHITKHNFKLLNQNLDKSIKRKLAYKIQEYIGVKWQSIAVTVTIVLGFMAVHSVVIYYLNKSSINTNITKSMKPYKEDIKRIQTLETSVNRIEKMLKKGIMKVKKKKLK